MQGVSVVVQGAVQVQGLSVLVQGVLVLVLVLVQGQAGVLPWCPRPLFPMPPLLPPCPSSTQSLCGLRRGLGLRRQHSLWGSCLKWSTSPGEPSVASVSWQMFATAPMLTLPSVAAPSLFHQVCKAV